MRIEKPHDIELFDEPPPKSTHVPLPDNDNPAVRIINNWGQKKRARYVELIKDYKMEPKEAFKSVEYFGGFFPE